MAGRDEKFDVVIVGGGIVGCAAAYYLAARGGVRVVLLERGSEVGGESTKAAAGILNPFYAASEPSPYFDFCVEAHALYHTLVPELQDLTGIDPRFLKWGVLGLLLDADDEKAAAEKIRWQHERGLSVERLTPEEALRREPAVRREIRGALYFPQDFHIDSGLLVDALAEAARRRGAEVRLGAAVTGLLREGRRVTGVETGAGRIAAGSVVLAAGEAAFHRLGDRTGRARLLAALLGCGLALSLGLALRFLGTGSFVEERLLGFRGYPGLLFGEPLWIRTLTALKVLERIARLLVFPIALSPDYSFNHLPIPRGLERGVAMGALLALAGAYWLWRVRSSPARLTLGIWALVAYLPVSNLFFPTTLLLGERTLYLSTVALAILLGTLFPAAQGLYGGRRRIAAGLLIGLVLALWGVRTIHRNPDWRDQGTLFAAAARTSPNSARVRMNHGVELLRAGKAQEAVRELEAAIWILPGYTLAHFNLSRAYESLGRLNDAQAAALRAILLRPDEVRSRLQLGIILLRAGRLKAAREVYLRALRMDPANVEAQSRLREIEQMTAR